MDEPLDTLRSVSVQRVGRRWRHRARLVGPPRTLSPLSRVSRAPRIGHRRRERVHVHRPRALRRPLLRLTVLTESTRLLLQPRIAHIVRVVQATATRPTRSRGWTSLGNLHATTSSRPMVTVKPTVIAQHLVRDRTHTERFSVLRQREVVRRERTVLEHSAAPHPTATLPVRQQRAFDRAPTSASTPVQGPEGASVTPTTTRQPEPHRHEQDRTNASAPNAGDSAPIDLDAVAEQVVRIIERRAVAQRERLGMI